MACEGLPMLGCCGGSIVPARVQAVTLTAKHLFSLFANSPNECSSFFKKRRVEAYDLITAGGPWYQITTTTRNPLHFSGAPGGESTVVNEERIYSGWAVGGAAINWESDVAYQAGGFVTERRFRPVGETSWWWRLVIEHSDPYSMDDGYEDFMALFTAHDVMDPSISLCRFNTAWQMSYREGAMRDDGWASGISDNFVGGVSCRDGALRPVNQTAQQRGGYAGFTKYGQSLARSFVLFGSFDDMGYRGGGLFHGRKIRLRMDRAACVWRYVANTACGGPGGGIEPAVPVCGEPSCQFVPLPSQDNPDPACPTLWPRYIEFALMPDGVNALTEEGDPTPDVWYTFAGCTGCFTRA